ncbi:MAG: aquaporin [Candidatus Omnitrophica bacterium CG_4_9_14_0_2_um_filter_42_8]|nr:MAG: aquaporin [Candidatus Omnitrophica bacterium CG22_combo_CG10-13_8_21_14_all_43_16]PJC48173.1 MAG: aquaporin [Candidatus Omnitrophica bacterium CG_4_9_14_0_2_um_filter_42_8]
MKSKEYLENLTGEVTGTFILVFFGCGAVAASVLFSAYTGLFQVAGIWGIGVTLGIYASRHLSCAHLNPAVSIGMVVAGRMHARKLPVYIIAQLIGAFLAAAAIYLLFANSICAYEAAHGILRGDPSSISSAMMFGEYFPNPGSSGINAVSLATAMFAEGIGTFMLVLMIFLLTEKCNLGRPENSLAPVFIGATVTVIICLIAPLTQAGLNPARDFGPRLFAFLSGWGNAAIPGPKGGFFTVYILSPILGGLLAAICFTKVIEPMMNRSSHDNDSCCKD